ncbi:replication-associated recombination protein A [Alkaliphilus serpentinus]|uniref:Replication-associated recombination protein A n=1 Tax=Alkaliphilus serpentinus TaxID=1482731 RepID=A0A833M6L0_9FIRM|nr:replication-associated recombination protein A [Alkaliphilus serpentinus]KAB3527638.1 replication-associated recombination protein A [Alkaliphilus serpentinus]
MDLFDIVKDKQLDNQSPLADKMRPKKLSDILGQDHILGKGKFLNRCVAAKRLPSIILYGPPGTGKTTVAKAISQEIEGEFFQLNAVTSGVKEIRDIVEKAEGLLGMYQKKSILFIDEIHRFSKNQQDALLPHVEKGLITLIGATTENPYFQVNGALLSRTTVLKLELLQEADIITLMNRALKDPQHGLGSYDVEITDEAIAHIAAYSGGDARRALNALEIATLSTPYNQEMKIIIDLSIAEESIQKKGVQYDKNGDQHYDVISAFIKSIRGSDPDAALHYLAKMIYSGEDPEFIARRLIISASEDIGNADPLALQVALSAHNAFIIIGMREGRIPLAQATTYLASAPKSNSSYKGLDEAIEDVGRINTTVPKHLRDASYRGGKEMGNGIDYLYPHNYDHNYVEQQYLPQEIINHKYYLPTENGYEKKIKKYLEEIHK